jgi:cytochrome c-type biogenesis protein
MIWVSYWLILEGTKRVTMSTQTSTLPVRLHITLHSLAFLLGVSMVFISFGVIGGFIGDFLFSFGDALRIIAGIFLIFFGLLMLRLIPIPFLQRDLRAQLSNKPSSYAGSVLVGLAFGAGWSPCIGPILAGIITIASAQGSALQGGLLLSLYSLGFAIPFLLAAQILPTIRKLNSYVGIVEKVGGILLIILGILLLSDAVNALSPYLANLGSLESLLDNRLVILPGSSIPPALYPLAFVAGALSFLSPCVLPILPSFMAYLTGVNADQLMRK